MCGGMQLQETTLKLFSSILKRLSMKSESVDLAFMLELELD